MSFYYYRQCIEHYVCADSGFFKFRRKKVLTTQTSISLAR
ncbi:hypothetical protein GPUN_1125 [Glaciecola punicea ACAM 611]|uniref:Uncharacterized protein n=1 Tax=Glaciecola punicea ACAM 611 TaxID=1121923 RepID=H5TAC8_9ALTE|nr:hypothetical protein GPUN_1125 [Glaciecola punicea ACAM 611]